MPTGEYRPPSGPPSRIYVPRPVVVHQPPPVSAPVPVGPPPRARRSGRSWLLVIAAVVVLAVIAGVGALLLQNRDQGEAAPPTNNTSTSAAMFEATLSTFTTTGTGFRADGALWKTQTYTTPEFGGLKPGAGLVLDLGKAQRVTEIDFTAQTGPLTVEARSADTLPTALAGWHKEGSAKQASGVTALPITTTEKHRYWMVWVTNLGPSKQAVVGDVKARGTK